MYESVFVWDVWGLQWDCNQLTAIECLLFSFLPNCRDASFPPCPNLMDKISCQLYLTLPALQLNDRQADGDAVSKYVSVTGCQYHWTMMVLAIVHICATLTYADWMFSLFYCKWGLFLYSLYVYCVQHLRSTLACASGCACSSNNIFSSLLAILLSAPLFSVTE